MKKQIFTGLLAAAMVTASIAGPAMAENATEGAASGEAVA